MNLFTCFVIVVLVSVAEAKLNFPKFKSPLEKLNFNASAPAIFDKQGSLRGTDKFHKNGVMKLDETFFEKGALTASYFNDGDCKFPIGQQVFTLNQCFPYWDSDLGVYLRLVMEVDTSNPPLYRSGFLAYADSECSEFLGVTGFGIWPAETCVSEGEYKVGHVDEVPAPNTVPNTHFFVGVYDTVDNCKANNPKVGLAEGAYIRKNFCYRGMDYDVFLNACDHNGSMLGAFYTSTDGSCSGTPMYSFRNNPAETCDGFSSLGPNGFSGYLNFQCL